MTAEILLTPDLVTQISTAVALLWTAFQEYRMQKAKKQITSLTTVFPSLKQ